VKQTDIQCYTKLITVPINFCQHIISVHDLYLMLNLIIMLNHITINYSLKQHKIVYQVNSSSKSPAY